MVESMKQLNRQAAQAAQAVGGIKGVTDITGFGLLGHALEMVHVAGHKFVIELNQVPLLAGAATYAADFVFPGGTSNNKMYYEKEVTFSSAVPDHKQWLLWDAQTSGGLLIAIPPERLAEFLSACHSNGRSQSAWVIGQVTNGQGIEVLP
jgi:selenide,water dikinase